MLMTEHNIAFYERLMADLRATITRGEFKGFADAFRARYRGSKGE